MGNPGVFQGNPHLYPPKPGPASTGAGFHKPVGKLRKYILYTYIYIENIIIYIKILYTTMRRHTPPHCTKKKQREGVHLCVEGEVEELERSRRQDAPNMKTRPDRRVFHVQGCSRGWAGCGRRRTRKTHPNGCVLHVRQGEGGREHIKHANRRVLRVW